MHKKGVGDYNYNIVFKCHHSCLDILGKVAKTQPTNTHTYTHKHTQHGKIRIY